MLMDIYSHRVSHVFFPHRPSPPGSLSTSLWTERCPRPFGLESASQPGVHGDFKNPLKETKKLWFFW